MVKFYDTYSTDEFNQLGKLLRLDEFVQLPIAQTEEGEIAQSVPTQLPLNEIVQSPIAQLDTPLINMPRILALATFTSHIEIMNRCKSYDERVFYMLYAARQRLNTEELRRCIVNQTYSTLLDKDKMLSPQLLKDYPSSEYLLKDKAVVEFTSDLVCSTITYWFGGQAKEQVEKHAKEQVEEHAREQVGEHAREQVGEQVLRLVNVIREDAYTLSDLLKKLNLKGRRNFLANYITPAIEGGYVLRAYPDKPKHPQQRYYLSEKGLKLVK